MTRLEDKGDPPAGNPGPPADGGAGQPRPRHRLLPGRLPLRARRQPARLHRHRAQQVPPLRHELLPYLSRPCRSHPPDPW